MYPMCVPGMLCPNDTCVCRVHYDATDNLHHPTRMMVSSLLIVTFLAVPSIFRSTDRR